MEDTLSDFLSPWSDWPEALRKLLREVATPSDRGRALAESLRRLVPQAVFARCRLEGDGRPGDDAPDADVLVVPLRGGDRAHGELVLGLPRGLPRGQRAAIGTLLALAAQGLALHLEVESLRAEREESADLVTVGEAMIGLTHAVNNSLNTMVLQTATVQMRVPAELREQLNVVRREGARAAARLRPLQQLRHAHLSGASGDLNSAMRAALAEAPALARHCALELGKDLPLVAVSPVALRRATTLLLRAGVSCSPSAEPLLQVRTARDEQGAAFVLEPEGPLDGEAPAQLTDLPLATGGAQDELERIAADSMVKRLGGRLALSKREDGGLTIRVSWPGSAGA